MELGFSKQFALIALNGQDSSNMTNAKKLSLRCMAAAVIAELHLDGHFQNSGRMYALQWQEDSAKLNWYQKVVLEQLFGDEHTLDRSLQDYLETAKKLSKKNLQEIEQALQVIMAGDGALEEIPALIGCDLYYDDIDMAIKEYRSDGDTYQRIAESLRAEILEDGVVTDEAIWMLWLLKESSCLYDLFSEAELKQVAERYRDLEENHPLAQQIFSVDIHHATESIVKGFLRMKSKIMGTAEGSGLNFLFPYLERSQAVFIETETYFAGKEERLKALKDRLEKHGHHFTVKRKGDVPLIKVDNMLYEAIPHVAQPTQIPIHGIRLRKYPLSM